jgi:hypothetical protein
VHIYILFIHSSVDEPLGWLDNLAIVTSATINIGIQVFLFYDDFDFYVDIPRSSIAESRNSPTFTFKGNCLPINSGYPNLYSNQQC